MDMALKEKFLVLWKKYFASAELPVAYFYSDEPCGAEPAKPAKEWSCFIAPLAGVRKGRPVCFDVDAVGCFGGKRYLGFTEKTRDGIEYFLSYGIEGKMEGERYKKTPELAKKGFVEMPFIKAAGKYIVFKRWDALETADEPVVVVFFAPPDVLSGLFTLANFDEPGFSGVIAPSSSGCGSMIMFPLREHYTGNPKAVLGMFDVSARPCVSPEVLTFAVPMKKFTAMVGNMEESFLITPSWEKVRKRIGKAISPDFSAKNPD